MCVYGMLGRLVKFVQPIGDPNLSVRGHGKRDYHDVTRFLGG